MIAGVVPLFNFKALVVNIYENGSINLRGLRYDKLAEKAVEIGFKHIEITGDFHYVLPGTFNGDVMKNLNKLRRSHDISFSVHLPLWSLELASPNRYIREASVKAILDAINHFEKLEPTNYVIHIWGALSTEFSMLKGPSFAKEMVNRYMQSNAAKSLEEILDMSGLDPKLLAVEDVQFPWDLTYELVEEYDTSICYDTGHLVSGQPGTIDPMDFLDGHFDRIIELHLHDGKPGSGEYNLGFQDHLPLGDGILPYCETIRFLLEKKFSGPVVFELSLDDALKSLERLRDDCGVSFEQLNFGV